MKRFVYLAIIILLGSMPVLSQDSVLNEQANMLYAENRIDEAFGLLLTVPPEGRTPTNWILLGNILQDKNREEDADFMYSQALLKDSKFYKAAYNLGNLYMNEERYNMAIQQYKAAAKMNPQFSYAFYNTGCAYLKLGKLKEARKEFAKAVELNPTNADFHYNLAYTLQKLNKPKDAQIYLDYYNKIKENNI